MFSVFYIIVAFKGSHVAEETRNKNDAMFSEGFKKGTDAVIYTKVVFA